MRLSSICVNLCKKKTQLTNINFERKILDFFLILELKWIHLLSSFISLFLQTRFLSVIFKSHFDSQIVALWYFVQGNVVRRRNNICKIVHHINTLEYASVLGSCPLPFSVSSTFRNSAFLSKHVK